jgi:LuxR family maltose regulon positive regulatory protein
VVRPALVPRTNLLDRVHANGHRIVSVVAPAGYGKSTLLAQWAARASGPVAWLSLDAADNDPETLLSYAAAALDRVEPIDVATIAPSGRGHTVAAAAVPRLTGAMAAMAEPVSLFLDHVEFVDNPQCLDVIAELALHLPARSQLALASRQEPPLPTARLRAAGDLGEVGVDDLAMDEQEARLLLDAAGVELSDEDAHELIERTEGWPVGLYLAALAWHAGGDAGGLRFTGDDRHMADYLRAEFLDRMPAEHVEFLTRTSMLDRMTGPLCDAVLDRSGSADLLEQLERSNLLLVPLDRRREWYRYHHLFRDLLRSELGRREPELEPIYHRRAAAWCEEHRLPELAIVHGQRGDDIGRVARLVAVEAQPAFASGRESTVRGWMTWLRDHGQVNDHPAPALMGAIVFAVTGRAADADQWAAIADAALAQGTMPDGSSDACWRALLRMYLCRDGIPQLRTDAETALDGLPPGSPWRPSVLSVLAVAHLLDDDAEAADTILADAVDLAAATQAAAAVAFALSLRASIAAAGGAWDDAAVHVRGAIDVAVANGVDEYSTMALGYAVAARVELHQGRADRAQELAARAAMLRPVLTYALPHASLLALVELARVYIALTDTSGARAVLRQANDILRRRPALGTLAHQVQELQKTLETMQAGAVGATSLTAAELRLVPFLSTHLTFPEIGERLHVSRHTVKTQAISIYQKLGVSSRSEAIDRLQAIGLVP